MFFRLAGGKSAGSLAPLVDQREEHLEDGPRQVAGFDLPTLTLFHPPTYSLLHMQRYTATLSCGHVHHTII